jgi:hypothetical protein
VFVAIAPRLGANLSVPCRDQESSDEIESLQALRFSVNLRFFRSALLDQAEA